MATGSATTGKMAVPKSAPGAPTAVAYVAPVANAAARDIPAIGKTVDSDDDTARLMIVTHYAGTNTVEVYAAGTPDGNTQVTGRLLSDGRIQTSGVGEENAAQPDRYVVLKSLGMFYLAGTDITLAPTDPDANGPTGDDIVLAGTKPKEVFMASGMASNGDPITVETPTWCVAPQRTTQTGIPPPSLRMSTSMSRSTAMVLAMTKTWR